MKMLTGVKAFFAAAVAAAGLVAFADPAVTVNSVTENGTWSTIDVNYTLSGVDTSANYKMQFDVTVNGETKTVTDSSFATKSNTSYTKTIDTKTLFGSARRNVKADVKVTLLDDQIDFAAGGQLWAGGPIFAGCNVGASKPEEYGYYFWWGDTVGYVWTGSRFDAVDGSKTGFSFSSVNCPTCKKSVAQLYEAGYIDANSADGKLKPEYDAARKYLGGDWRMPTKAEIKALVDNCNRTWTTRNGVKGYAVTGKGDYASKGIFLPAAGDGIASTYYDAGSGGRYWSSTPNSSSWGWLLKFVQNSFDWVDADRYQGYTIRPVR